MNEVLKKDAIIGGAVVGREIYLPPLPLLGLLESSFHEAGHVIGEELSFTGRNGESPEVLTPREIKELSFDSPNYPELTDDELDELYYYIMNPDLVSLNSTSFSIVRKVLNLFTKGNFDLDSLHFHNISGQKLNELVKGKKSTTIKFGESKDGQLQMQAVDSQAGVLVEASPMFVQIACMAILEKLIYDHAILDENQAILRTTSPFPSHQKALEIAYQDFDSDVILPSFLDIKEGRGELPE